MSLLSSALKASVERLRDRTFTTSIEILTKQSTPNGAGGQTETWTTTATLKGRVRRARQVDYLRYSGEQPLPVGTWLVMFAPAVEINAADRLRASGITFSIIGSDAGRTDALVQTLFCLSVADLT